MHACVRARTHSLTAAPPSQLRPSKAEANATRSAAAEGTVSDTPLADETKRACAHLRVALESAESDEQRQHAFTALIACMGSVVCPSDAARFGEALQASGAVGEGGDVVTEKAVEASEGGGDVMEAFEALRVCTLDRLSREAEAAAERARVMAEMAKKE